MLAQNHSAGAEDSGEQDGGAEPWYGIVCEDDRESHHSADHATYGSKMSADFPPCVDDGTDDLYA